MKTEVMSHDQIEELGMSEIGYTFHPPTKTTM